MHWSDHNRLVPQDGSLFGDGEEILSFDELRRRRSLDEFFVWVRQVSSRASEDKQSKATFRLASGAVKVFREEVLPFYTYALQTLEGQDVEICFPGDSESRDVVVVDLETGESSPYEVTVATDGYGDRLRMELLSVAGSAPGFGKIERVPLPDGRVRIDVEDSARYLVDAVDEVVELITSCLEKKVSKIYPCGTTLIVGFFDAGGLLQDDYNEILSRAASVPGLGAFREVYLVGSKDTNFCGRVMSQVGRFSG